MAVIVMNWTPSNISTIGYEIRYAKFSVNPLYIYLTTTNTSITIPGLIDNESYIIAVRALCEGGLHSVWSNTQIVTCNDVTPCTIEGYAVYGDGSRDIVYGNYYNYHAANSTYLPIGGWHLPTNVEWNNLFVSYGGLYSTDDNIEIVDNVTNLFKTPNLWLPGGNCSGTNITEFGIRPNGFVTELGASEGRESRANYWARGVESYTLTAFYKNFEYNTCTMVRYKTNSPVNNGFTIRLVKDDPTGWQAGDTYVDYEGNVYMTKLMDDGKVWLLEDLRTEYFSDGSPIPINPVDWSTTTSGAIHTY